MRQRVLKILLVEDCAMLAVATSQLLRRDERFEIAGIASAGEEALTMVQKLRPDIVVTDLEMPGIDGAEFIRRQMSVDRVPIVVFSGLPPDHALPIQAIAAGARALVVKPSNSQEVEETTTRLSQAIIGAWLEQATSSFDVLVVDDSEADRIMLSRQIRRLGCNVVEARSGLQALEIAENARIDLVVLDLAMPVLNGFEVLRQLRLNPRLDSIPVVIVSGFHADRKLDCLRLGASEFLPKPVNEIVFRRHLQDCLADLRLRRA